LCYEQVSLRLSFGFPLSNQPPSVEEILGVRNSSPIHLKVNGRNVAKPNLRAILSFGAMLEQNLDRPEHPFIESEGGGDFSSWTPLITTN